MWVGRRKGELVGRGFLWTAATQLACKPVQALNFETISLGESSQYSFL